MSRIDREIMMEAGLAAVYLDQRNSLLWRVLRIVRDRQTAEDLIQESYLRARNALASGPVEHIEGLLHETARNLAIDHVRKVKRRALVEDAFSDPEALLNVASNEPPLEDRIIQRERLRSFEMALSSLPERARRVWLLNRMEGWTYPQIASHLQISPNTVFNDMKLAAAHCLDAMRKFDRD